MLHSRAEHVWVTGVTVWGDRGAPGLLIGWRQRKAGWEGWVIVVEPGSHLHDDGPYVRQFWTPADMIRSAGTLG